MAAYCFGCDKLFQPSTRRQIYCHVNCRAAKMRRIARERGHGTFNCKQCGVEVTRKPSQVRGMFCSSTCYHTSSRRKERYLDYKGYASITIDRDDPYFAMAQSHTRVVPEHRYFMARHLGRCLESWEQVHHLNGVKDDNRLENLQIQVQSHGNGVRYCCADCGSQNLKPLPL